MAGRTASLSCARTMMASAPWVISCSISVACFSADDAASVEMYCAPAASSTALMAGSSRSAQRSSWKLFQDTPTTSPSSWATTAPMLAMVPAAATVSAISATTPLLVFRIRGPPPMWNGGRSPILGERFRSEMGTIAFLRSQITALTGGVCQASVTYACKRLQISCVSYASAPDVRRVLGTSPGLAAAGTVPGRQGDWRRATRPDAVRSQASPA